MFVRFVDFRNKKQTLYNSNLQHHKLQDNARVFFPLFAPWEKKLIVWIPCALEEMQTNFQCKHRKIAWFYVTSRAIKLPTDFCANLLFSLANNYFSFTSCCQTSQYSNMWHIYWLGKLQHKLVMLYLCQNLNLIVTIIEGHAFWTGQFFGAQKSCK